MVDVDISNIMGTVVLLLFFIALEPLISSSVGLLVPKLGATESLIVRSIPLMILIGIALNLMGDDEPNDAGLRR